MISSQRFLCCLATLGPVDWTNSVLLPIGIGIPLSLYTGFVASRMFTFFTVRAKAVMWIYELVDFFDEEHKSPHDMSISFGKRAMGIMLELRSLGHEQAKQQMVTICRLYWNKCAELLGIPTSENGVPTFPAEGSIDPFRWSGVLADFRDYYAAQLEQNAATVASLRPNVRALLSPRPFPDYMTYKGRLIGLFVNRITKN